MKAFELIKRKYRHQLSDIQMMILLELAAREEVRFMELVEATGASASGIGNTLAKPWFEPFIERRRIPGGAFYSLSHAGRCAIAEVMGEAPLRRISAG